MCKNINIWRNAYWIKLLVRDEKQEVCCQIWSVTVTTTMMSWQPTISQHSHSNCQGRVSRHFRICPNVDDCSSDLPCLIWSITQCSGHGPVRYVVVVPVFTRPGLYRAVQALCTATQVTSFTRHLSQTYSAPTAYYGDTGVGQREKTEFSLDIILADIIQLKAAWCNSSVPEQSQNWFWSEQPVKLSPTLLQTLTKNVTQCLCLCPPSQMMWSRV